MQKDIEKLQGNWNIVSLEVDGRTMSAPSLGGARIAIQGDHFTSIGMGATYEGTIALDPAASPKAFSLNFTSGPEKGNANLGIYELKGDTWRICLATRGPNRPQTFAAAPGTGIALEVLQRGEPQSAPAAINFENIHFEPAAELAGEWSMVSGAFDGLPLEKSFLKLGKRVVNGSDMSVTFGREVYSKAKYTVDRSKNPIAMDIYNTAGANAGRLQHAIYEVDGKTLKLSIAAAGAERPADFSSKAGDGRTVVIWTHS
jgi:uncharacterized protein (TIGR03067 family)